MPSDIVKSTLEKVSKSLEHDFDKVWGLLPPTAERDTIMFHILAAKRELNEFIKEWK